MANSQTFRSWRGPNRRDWEFGKEVWRWWRLGRFYGWFGIWDFAYGLRVLSVEGRGVKKILVTVGYCELP